MTVEHLGGHLAAAGEFGPIAGVRRRRHDLGIHRGRRHAGQQHRRLAGQFAELGDELVSGGGMRHMRRKILPVLRAARFGVQRGQRRAIRRGRRLDHADAGALDHFADQLAQRGARTEVHDPQGRRIVGGKCRAHGRRPIHMVEQHLIRERPGTGLVQLAGAGPLHGLLDGRGHQRGVERQRHLKIFEHRVEYGAATHLVVAQLGLAGMLPAHFDGEAGQILRIPGQHVVVGRIGDGDGDRTVRIDHTGGQHSDLFLGGSFHRQHRAGLAMRCGDPQLTGLAGAGGADQRGHGENLVNLLAGGGQRTGVRGDLCHMDTENALRMPQ